MALTERNWLVGFGPITLKPGEKQRINAQVKCRFRGEKILASDGDYNTDIHLLGVYLGYRDQKEILHLNGDSIDLGSKKITAIEEAAWCSPASPLEVEVVNRSTTEKRRVYLDIAGVALL